MTEFRDDIAEEFSEASGRGREWFDGEGYRRKEANRKACRGARKEEG